MPRVTVRDVTLEFAVTGPRITGLRIGGENLFVEVPDAVIERPGGAPFRLLVGHRLWRAPEIPEITYEPDDAPVRVVQDGATTTLRGVADPNGVVKEIAVTIGDTGEILVDHRIVNTGTGAIETAPWAITQFPPDGAAVIPIPVKSDGGYRADRSVVLWPYTDPGAPGIGWGPDAVVIAGGDGSKQKIGTSNTAGWLAYHRGDHLFVKWSSIHDPALAYVDRGASIQVYRDHRFIELETLGPLRTVAAGASIGHRERWRVYETGPVDTERLPSTVARLLAGGPVGV
jgi:hypothetical protein